MQILTKIKLFTKMYLYNVNDACCRLYNFTKRRNEYLTCNDATLNSYWGGIANLLFIL